MFLRKHFKTRAILLAIIWLILLIISMSLLSLLLASLSGNMKSQTIVSLSWAGYTVADGVSATQLEVTFVNASWVVPQVNASSGNGRSSAWIGIGGQTDGTLIQVGTEHIALDGSVTYMAWYELLPDYAITIPEITVAPGDVITAAITLVNFNTDEWNIRLSDATSGQTFSQNFIYNSTRSSGEWIVERPTVNKQISSLANFGSITFSDCNIRVNGVVGHIGNFTYSRVQMTDERNIMLASVTPLDFEVSGFTVNYR
ncbi:MAG: G1 family endopeptidase [Candidatus Bathyarchaeota archaeon]|nr:G1 family endopeptidase [Candidatus Bathyarchaeota archaeon]